MKAKMAAYIAAEDSQFQEPAYAQNQGEAYLQEMVRTGVMTQEEADEIRKAKLNGTEDTSNAPSSQPGSVSEDTEGVENLKSFPPNLRLSRNFTLGQVTDSPYVYYPHWRPDGIVRTGNAGLTPGQLVANAKLLAVNCLDAIKDRYPNMLITSTVRRPSGNPTSQHPKFQAADIQLPGKWTKHYDMACWIKDNIPYDQLLLEYSGNASWVHVSYANPPIKKAGDPTKVAVMNGGTNKFLKTNGLANLDNQFGIR